VTRTGQSGQPLRIIRDGNRHPVLENVRDVDLRYVE